MGSHLYTIAVLFSSEDKVSPRFWWGSIFLYGLERGRVGPVYINVSTKHALDVLLANLFMLGAYSLGTRVAH